MAQFNHFYLSILKKTEGGLARLQGDTGGLTYSGISQAFHPLWPGWPAVENTIAQHPDKSDSELTGILANNNTLQSYVLNFYSPIWHRLGAGDLSQDLANLFMDFYIHKPVDSVKVVQRTINQYFGGSLVVDGAIGPKTRKAMREAPQSGLYNRYRESRIAWYKDQSNSSPSFWKAWVNRVMWHFPEKKKPLA